MPAPHPWPVLAALWTHAHMGEYLRARRIDACLTVHDLARDSGVDRARLVAVESGWNTLGEHHWAAVCRVLPSVDRRVLAHYAARQNRPPWYAGPRRVLRRLCRRSLPVLGVFVAGTLYGAMLLTHRRAAFLYGMAIVILYGTFALAEIVLGDD